MLTSNTQNATSCLPATFTSFGSKKSAFERTTTAGVYPSLTELGLVSSKSTDPNQIMPLEQDFRDIDWTHAHLKKSFSDNPLHQTRHTYKITNKYSNSSIRSDEARAGDEDKPTFSGKFSSPMKVGGGNLDPYNYRDTCLTPIDCSKVDRQMSTTCKSHSPLHFSDSECSTAG